MKADHLHTTRLPSLFLLAVVLLCTGCLERFGPEPPAQTEPAGPALPGADLQAVLSAPEQVSQCEPVPVEFTVTNWGDRTLYLLKWYTPLEGIAGNIFRVTRDGQELDYLGILAMRGDPAQEDYITLEVGESASAQFDISEYYDFSQPGEYQVAYQSPWISFVTPDPEGLALSVDDLGPVKIPSTPVVLSITPGTGNCAQEVSADNHPDENQPLVTLSGRVLDASPSARIILLEEEVNGFSAIAVTDETLLVDQNGEPLQLNEVLQGWELEAAGKPGEGGALLADRVVITR